MSLLLACGSQSDDAKSGAVAASSAGAGGTSNTGAAGTGGGHSNSPSDAGGPLPSVEEAGNCCLKHDQPGCDHSGVAECVCKEDRYCCLNSWDDACVTDVEQLNCGVCPISATPSGNDDPSPDAESNFQPQPNGAGGASDAGAPLGSCHDELQAPGCADSLISACVCYVDAYCCDTRWDWFCVSEVESLGCGDCGSSHTSPCSGDDAGAAGAQAQ